MGRPGGSKRTFLGTKKLCKYSPFIRLYCSGVAAAPSTRLRLHRSFIYAARVRAGLVPATRRNLYGRLQPLIVPHCPFESLPEAKSGRWGQGLTAAKMKKCIWVKPELVANFEFLEWTDSSHVRHIKFLSLRDDKDPRKVVRE